MTHNYRRQTTPMGAVVLIGVLLSGCHTGKSNRIYYNPYPEPHSLAVAPFVNQSGSPDIDVMAVTDEFYAELQQVDGLEVVSVDRVLAELGRLELHTGIRGPGDALSLAEALETDGIIVGSITRYDPYFPPKLGMAVQLYGRDPGGREEPAKHLNPGEIARSAKPFRLGATEPYQARTAVIRIIDSDQNDVVERIKEYAESRRGNDRPPSWKTYTTRQNFLRFVSHEIIGELLAQERDWLAK